MRILHKGEYEEIHIQEINAHGFFCVYDDDDTRSIFFPEIILSVVTEDRKCYLLPIEYNRFGEDIFELIERTERGEFRISNYLSRYDLKNCDNDLEELPYLVEEAKFRGVFITRGAYDYLKTLKKS